MYPDVPEDAPLVSGYVLWMFPVLHVPGGIGRAFAYVARMRGFG
jgi:hypothetical protein